MEKIMHLESNSSKKKTKQNTVFWGSHNPIPVRISWNRWIAVYLLAHLAHSWDSLRARAFYSF